MDYYRTHIDYLNKFDYSSRKDTIYILEMYGIQGNVLVTIWNKSNILSFTNEQGYFISKKEHLFSKHIINLVSEWDISTIKKEETKHPILPNDLIYATRIIFNKKQYHIDCFKFNDFFNIEKETLTTF